jgi:hypothetical protein
MLTGHYQTEIYYITAICDSIHDSVGYVESIAASGSIQHSISDDVGIGRCEPDNSSHESAVSVRRSARFIL